MNKSIVKRSGILSIVLIIVFFVFMECRIFANFSYEHDPMLNPKAAQDIIVNPEAVYGYSPNPESTRLGDYAAFDWTDPALVEQGKAERESYLAQFQRIYDLINEMKSEGKSLEEIACAASKLRNEIRLEAYNDDPEGLELMKKSNLETYGNENGPTPEFLYEKYGSWEGVLAGATSSNPGMDACLGLYDKYYDTYGLEDSDPEVPTIPEDDPSGGQDSSSPAAPAQTSPQQSMEITPSPKTGETDYIFLWISLALAGAIFTGIVAAVKLTRRLLQKTQSRL